jgi:hypothetical protein
MKTALIIAFGLCVVLNPVLLALLRPHRVDLAPHQSFTEGRSRAWQENVFSFQNYDRSGKRLVVLLIAVQGIWLVACILFVRWFGVPTW